MAKHVPFITVEDSDDLIVSFGLGESAAHSLTLLRTPKFEPLLPEEERGVSVNDSSSTNPEREFLVSARWHSSVATIESTRKSYSLDIAAVDPAEIKFAKKVLRKMNFDHRFEVTDV